MACFGMASSNELGRSSGLTYIDTIQRYINPRIVCALGLAACAEVGMQDIANAVKVSAFPNPANTNVTISSNTTSGQIKSVRMFDVTGREVLFTSNLNTAAYQINRNDLIAGIYLVQVQTEKGRSSIKVIFE